jgi:hypothetical protein
MIQNPEWKIKWSHWLMETWRPPCYPSQSFDNSSPDWMIGTRISCVRTPAQLHGEINAQEGQNGRNQKRKPALRWCHHD